MNTCARVGLPIMRDAAWLTILSQDLSPCPLSTPHKNLQPSNLLANQSTHHLQLMQVNNSNNKKASVISICQNYINVMNKGNGIIFSQTSLSFQLYNCNTYFTLDNNLTPLFCPYHLLGLNFRLWCIKSQAFRQENYWWARS